MGGTGSYPMVFRPTCCACVDGTLLPSSPKGSVGEYQVNTTAEEYDGMVILEDGMRSIHKAAYDGDAEKVIVYLQHGSSVDALNSNCLTPLHLASANGHEAVVRALLAWNADVNVAAPTDNATPLHMASEAGHDGVVQQLIAASADVCACTKDGCTALHQASRMSHTGAALTLMEGGADLNASNCYGYTPFTMAEDWGTCAMANLLSEHGGHR
mmetsp:Transcript_33272/g.95713  ORF Transcript_33272/g.95713 Transcript_33272/m.95713 type:complete len:213 (-) Transcript_33272:116-754(-)